MFEFLKQHETKSSQVLKQLETVMLVHQSHKPQDRFMCQELQPEKSIPSLKYFLHLDRYWIKQNDSLKYSDFYIPQKRQHSLTYFFSPKRWVKTVGQGSQVDLTQFVLIIVYNQ